MCYHYSLGVAVKKLYTRYAVFQVDYDLLKDFDGLPRFHANGFDHPEMPVVVNKEKPAFELAHWGLIPAWARSQEEANRLKKGTLNARSEEVFEKASFKNSIRSRRCLVPADGFFEWMDVKGKKFPFFIYLKTKDIFSFAGIYDEWIDRLSGRKMKTFSILTTEANPLMATIHNKKKRMPVILPKELEDGWLLQELNRSDIEKLMVPYVEAEMAAHPIDKLITSREEDSNVEKVRELKHYPELDWKEN